MTNTTAAAIKTAAAAPIANACLCSNYEVVIREFDTPDGPDYDAESTGCTETTAREFAPGHDAKLKSLLIRAGIAGHAVRYGSITTTAEKAAADFAFSYMVQMGIERGRSKAAAKAEKKAARKSAPRAPRVKSQAVTNGPVVLRELLTLDAPETAAPEIADAPATPETVQVKIGRWTYAATIAANGDAHYVNAKQIAAVAVKGTFKLV